MKILDNEGQVLAEFSKKMNGAYLSYAQLAGACLRRVQLEFAFLDDADLRDADMQEADLYMAVLECANMEGANLRGARLQGANLRRANLRGADLTAADLSISNIQTSTKLQGCDMFTAKLDGSIFLGAQYDHSTKFPASFDPLTSGLILKPE
jgi:uncharacterized protein YjbI with pentapeptide repeats